MGAKQALVQFNERCIQPFLKTHTFKLTHYPMPARAQVSRRLKKTSVAISTRFEPQGYGLTRLRSAQSGG